MNFFLSGSFFPVDRTSANERGKYGSKGIRSSTLVYILFFFRVPFRKEALMIPTSQPINHLWSLILAGGEGERTRPFIEQWLGYSLPKQYCTFVGTRSMLQHTLDRADRLSLKDQKVTVVGQIHQHLAWSHREQIIAGQVILQPKNCNAGAGVFLPLTYVLTRDPKATVVIYPSDHFVFPEERFVDTVQQAIRVAEILTDRLIVLGVHPSHLELEYGWLEKGEPIGWGTGARVYHVKSFIEKPDAIQGLNAMTSGALWNTSVIAGKATTLWHLGWNCFPELMDRFARLREAIGTPRESQILQTIYQDMPHCNFSSDFLQRIPGHVGLMELDGVLWSDWGRPERIVETLRLLGKKPAFPTDHVGERPGSGSYKSHIEVA
jgi:mannose-1-phosphate guanylyltransferase